MIEDLKTKFENIRANHARAVEAEASGEDFNNIANQLTAVVADMGWLLENFCSPGMVISALSITKYARQLEREETIRMLEFQRVWESAPYGKIRERFGEVTQGAVLGTLDALIQHLKELP